MKDSQLLRAVGPSLLMTAFITACGSNHEPTVTTHNTVSGDQAKRYLVQYQADPKEGPDNPAAASVLSSMTELNVQVLHQYRHHPLISVKAAPLAMDQLQKTTKVRIYEDRPVPPILAESVPHIGGPQAHQHGARGIGQVVAVLDTGVDIDHPQLQGKIVAEACFSSTDESYRSVSLCPDGASSSVGQGSGDNCDVDRIPSCMHGTHVAGIAAGPNGVAPAAEIASIQVFSEFRDPRYCLGRAPCVLSFTSDQIRALEHIMELREKMSIAAVNFSLGGGSYTEPCSDHPMAPLVQTLRQNGISTVIAAGNRFTKDAISAPACIPSAISVGSTGDNSDQVSPFSSASNFLSIFAPGQSITSLVPGGEATHSGTSMAAPHVAGGFAAIRSLSSEPANWAAALAIGVSGIPVTDERFGTVGVTKPRLDVGRATAILCGHIDTDQDGVPDRCDNCVSVANPDQNDHDRGQDDDTSQADVQHYGDACDFDLDNDGIVGASDFFAVLRPCLNADLQTEPGCRVADLDGDETVSDADFLELRSHFGEKPGPGI